jgi:hypothetical protein
MTRPGSASQRQASIQARPPHDARDIRSSRRPTDQTEGLNQADDIRRLAQRLREQDRSLRDNGVGGLKAVGVLGSDVYDKLELLKALRPILPQSTFFTNNLDARLGHPDEWAETHNLVVVSASVWHYPTRKSPHFETAGRRLFLRQRCALWEPNTLRWIKARIYSKSVAMVPKSSVIYLTKATGGARVFLFAKV